MWIKVRGALRERELAGDARAGEYARELARRRQWAFVARQWRLLTRMVLSIAAVATVVVLLMPGPFLRGFVVGAALLGAIAAVSVTTMQMTGTAPTSMGAAAEQWTASELRPLRRAGWMVINRYRFEKADVDHIVIGPHAVFAVETKWSAAAGACSNPIRTCATRSSR